MAKKNFLSNPIVDISQYHVILSKETDEARLWVAMCNVDDECGAAVAALIGLYSMASSHQPPSLHSLLGRIIVRPSHPH